MFALAYLFFLLLYVAFSVVVVIAVGRWATQRGKVRWKWMLGAAGVMWLIVFWDWIPTVLLHRHLCNTWAGVTIYKTPEQWLAENQGNATKPLRDAQSLVSGPHPIVVARPEDRFALVSFRQWYWPLTLRTATRQLVDRLDGTVVVEERSVAAGNPEPSTFGQWRQYFIWLQFEECRPGVGEAQRADNEFRAAERTLK